MLFQITEIDFDFEMENDEYPSNEYQQEVTESYVGEIWEADDEDDLIEEITASSGWCIRSIDFNYILS